MMDLEKKNIMFSLAEQINIIQYKICSVLYSVLIDTDVDETYIFECFNL